MIKNKRGAAARNKGHSYERACAKSFRNYFPLAATTRAESALLDSCKIDLCNIPFNVQCKSGYSNHRPNFLKLKQEVDDSFSKKIPKEHMLHQVTKQPFVLFHKDGVNETVTMEASQFFQLLDAIYPKVIETDNKIDQEEID